MADQSNLDALLASLDRAEVLAAAGHQFEVLQAIRAYRTALLRLPKVPPSKRRSAIRALERAADRLADAALRAGPKR